MARRHHLGYLASAALVAAAAAPCLGVGPAYASTMDNLNLNYQLATSVYQSAIVEQVQNGSEIVAVQNAIHINESELEQSKEQLGDTAVTLYKNERHRSDLMDMVLDGASLTDAITRYENYVRVEQYCREKLADVKAEREALSDKRAKLEAQKGQIRAKVADALREVQEAEARLRDADHSDGASYHQRQKSSSNCGATAFIVGVNILLHDNRYTDNVAVWQGPGFNGDSTTNLGFKAATWLMANGLSDQISVQTIAGDIHTAKQLQAELEDARVVVISSGPGSIWQRADGKPTGPGTFPDGHWIVFYHYEDGVFYANDSSVKASKGAGCAYTEEQMQQWLDGRSNHFAVSLSKKSLSE